MTYQGVGASGGIGIGRVVRIAQADLDYSGVSFAGSEAEKERFQRAVEAFCAKTQEMAERMKSRVGEKEAEILSGQIMMLSDPFLQSQVEEAIDSGLCAEAAVDQVCGNFIEMFSSTGDELMGQRATDVGDIRTRMLEILLGVSTMRAAEAPAGSVLVAADFTPSMTVGIDKEKIAGIATEIGGKTSHSAILARALGIPAVLGVPNISKLLQDGQSVIVDGSKGIVLAEFDEHTLAEYEHLQQKEREAKRQLDAYRDCPTQDASGNRFAVYANIGKPEDAQAALEYGAEGIGLFRTEFLFMDRTSLPDEEEQYKAYIAVAETMAGKEVIIRTLDIGGDKDLPYLHLEKEENPFLGHRAIRYCLSNPEVFSVQLRALLRAGALHKNLKIMLPLITGVEEIRAAKELIETCKRQLQKEGAAYDADIPVGIMIETPAAARIADLLAKEADFFSIGTNDLTQYTLAVDRGNAKVEGLYTAFHPAVLRNIRDTITAAKQAGIPVGMCGEAAADKKLIPLLLAWGLDEFSVSPAAVLATRKTISEWSAQKSLATAQGAMELSTASEIESSLESST